MSQVIDPGKNQSKEQIEARMAATRERLTASVDLLGAKLDVKGQAQDKLAETTAAAQEKLQQGKELAVEKVQQAGTQVSRTSRELVTKFKTASRPVQAAVAAAPVVLLAVIIRGARRG